MRFHEAWRASSADAFPTKSRSHESSMKPRLRPSASAVALIGLWLGFTPRPLSAQSCTAPGFLAPPTGTNLVSTAPSGVVAPGRIATGDFNADGRLDFVVLDSTNPSLQIFLQQPFPPGGYVGGSIIGTLGIPTSVRVADINHDGKQDVLVSTKGSTQGRAYLGNGSGGISSVTNLVTVGTSTDASDLVVLDIDRDGLLDVVIADVSTLVANQGLYAFKGNGNGTFAAPVKFSLSALYGSLGVADYDRDGKLDLVATTASNSPAVLELFTGTSTFSPPFVSVLGISVPNNALPAFNTVATGDFNNDGIPDVALATGSDVEILRGNASAPLLSTSGNFNLPTGALSVQAADVNRDGDLDLVFIANPAPRGFVGVMLGNGSGSFKIPPGLTTFPPTSPPSADAVAVALGDFDGDGRTDVAAANQVGRKVGILLDTFGGGCPAPSFGPSIRTFAYFDPRALALGDFNGDGRTDVVAARTGFNQVSVLLASSAVSLPIAPTVAPGFGGELNVGGFSSPRAVAVGRFDADAIQDLAVANGGSGTLSILRGNGSGGFVTIGAVPVGPTPVAIAVGDFNDNDKRDLAVVNQGNGTVSIRLGNGDGTFSSAPDVTVGTTPIAIAVADFDLNGRPDLAVANFGSNTVSIRLGGSAGTFTGTLDVGVGNNPISLDVGDFNSDGRPDLVVANQGSANLSILTGNGNGTFTPATPVFLGSSPGAVVVTKLNGDSLPDLGVTLPGLSSVRTLVGSGPATFTGGGDFYVGASPQSLAQGDVTEDGKPDLLVGFGGSFNYLAVLTSLGNGLMAIAPSYSEAGPLAVATADFDRDGDLDLVFGDTSDLSFQRNAGNGTFSPGGSISTLPSVQPRTLAVADFDRDGREDLAVGFLNDPVKAYRGNGAGSFAPFTGPIPAVTAAGLAVADFDKDGKADIVVAQKFTAQAQLLPGDGLGGFSVTPLVFNVLNNASDVAVGDFDGNGLVDFVVSHDNSNKLAVFLNFYGFTPPIQASDFVRVTPDPIGDLTFGVLHVAAGDFNRDGKLDLVVDDISGGIEILRGNGAGQFVSTALGTYDAAVSSLAFADVNQDGFLDVVATVPSLNSVAVWTGDGNNLARPTYYTSSAPGGAADAQPTDVAVGDFDDDGSPDLAVANSVANSFSIYRNTGCTSRRLTMVTEVPACTTPNAAFATQPQVGVRDDGGNLSACETGLVTASIAPGTGTVGAVLSPPPLSTAPFGGIANYSNLRINLPGRRYRLQFDLPTVGSALGRTFSQGLTAAISGGPVDLCLGQPATFAAATGFDSYAWTLEPPAAPFSFLPNVTLSTLGVGLHDLQLAVTQDGCSDTDMVSPNVNADLANVTVSTPGPVTVCTNCVGGVVSETHAGGGTIMGYQWLWGTAAGGPYNVIPSQTGATYTINGADFPGPGTYYLVTSILPTCGAAVISSNQIVVQVQPSVPADVVRFLTVTTSGTTNTLEWVNPPGHDTVRIRYNQGATSCAFPSDPSAPTSSFLEDNGGPMGGRDSTIHSGLNPNTKYCYTVWVNLGGSFGPGRSNAGRTFVAGAVQWAFSIGTLALIPPGNGNNVVHTVAMDNSLHTVTKGPGGGTWPTAPSMWMPQEMNGPSQGRPAGIPFNAGGATKLIFLGDQAGVVHAFNEDTGDEVWATSQLGEAIQAGASGIFKNFGGFDDMVLVGTYNSSTGNKLYALNPVSGNTIWSYDGNDGIVNNGRIGIISGQPAVDYDPAHKRVYFASHAFGGAPDDKTLWCVHLTDGKSCWAQRYDNVETGVTLQGDKLFVGTTLGDVLALNVSDGTQAWSLTTGDGRVRGYVAPDRLTGDIYFSTDSKVWRVPASGGPATWSVPFTAPSTPVYAPGDSVVYVGGQGSLVKLNVVGGGPAGSFLLGDGSSKVGSPTLDLRNGFAYVGTEAGVVYAVRIP
jgi:outer membrane protein assembly factor BamB